MKFNLLLLAFIVSACTTKTELLKPPIDAGKNIAFNREKGNCLACHEIDNGESPGNIGPPLKNLSARFKNKQALKDQIWDATQFNPETSMPPFGKNRILNHQEIDLLVDYLWGLK